MNLRPGKINEQINSFEGLARIRTGVVRIRTGELLDGIKTIGTRKLARK